MSHRMTGVGKVVPGIMREAIGRIIATHLAYTALGVVLFAPLLGVVGQLLLRLSGQPAIADLMYRAVRIGGVPCTGLPWPWDYGWPECD